MRFSKRFRTYSDWVSTQDRGTAYIRRIARSHALYPNASLNQLRGHVKIKAKPVPLTKRAWNTLSPKEKATRERALAVLSLARRSGQSLSKLSKQQNVSPRAVLKATRGFRKVKGRWKAKKRDQISRTMAINEHGKETFIEVTDSRYASLIGKYHSAVREYLNTGDTSVLAEFKGKKVKDSSGKFHTLETNPKAIREIEERKEEPEIYESIYEVS